MPDALIGTLRVELPVRNNNGTTFKHRSKRGNGRGPRWGWYISWRVSSVVWFPGALGLNGRSVLFLVFDTSRRKLSPTQMPLAPSIPYTFWYHVLPHEQQHTVTWPFCFTGLRIGASGESVSPPTTGRQKGQKRSGVSVGKYVLPTFLLNEATVGTPRHVCTTFNASVRRFDLPVLKIEWNITQKLDPTLKLSNCKQLNT